MEDSYEFSLLETTEEQKQLFNKSHVLQKYAPFLLEKPLNRYWLNKNFEMSENIMTQILQNPNDDCEKMFAEVMKRLI